MADLSFGDNGSDTISLNGGSVGVSVNAFGGDDTITLDGGTAVTFDILGGNGVDTINLTSGSVGRDVRGDNGNDTITMTGGSVGNNVYLGATNFASTDTDSFTMTGGTVSGSIFGDNGNDTITLSGGTVGDGAIGVDARNGDDVIIVNGATVSGDIFGRNGNDSLTWSAGELNSGFIGENGSDTAIISGTAVYDGDETFDGGDDLSTGDGWIDTLTYSGITGTAAAGTVTNWENIIIDGGSIGFSGALATGTDPGTGLTLQNGAMLDAMGGFALTGNLNNSGGVISSQDGTAGDAITITGDYSGGGVVQVDADFENDVVDTLTIGGNVTGGPTLIQVNNVTADLSLTTGNDLVLVDVAGTTTDGDFALSGPLTSGGFSYALELQGAQFALVGMLNVLGAVFEYSSSFFLGLANDNLPTLEQRIGQRIWFDGENRDEEVRPGKGLWVRFHGSRVNGLNTSNSFYADRSQHVQIGADLPIETTQYGHLVFGISGQFGSASTDISSMGGRGSIHSETYSLGTRATWYGVHGTYFNAQTHLTLINSDYATDTNGSLAEDKKATAYGISAELGQRIPVYGHTVVGTSGAVQRVKR